MQRVTFRFIWLTNERDAILTDKSSQGLICEAMGSEVAVPRIKFLGVTPRVF
jgi:hypothetical protein